MQGIRIEATVPSFFVNRFGPKLKEYSLITVSKFGVKENSDQWRVTQHPYKIVLTITTVITSDQLEENTCVGKNLFFDIQRTIT